MRFGDIRAITKQYRALLVLPVILLLLPGFDVYKSQDIARPVKPLSPLEKKLKNTGKVFLSLKHYDFLIPAAYLNAYRVKWRPERQYRAGAFSLDVLLPGMDHINAQNKADFTALGHGRKLSIGVGERDLPILEQIKNLASSEKLILDLEKLKLPGLHKLPDLRIFQEKQAWYLYNSEEYGRALIECGLPNTAPSPGCQLDWDFFPGLDFYTTYSISYFPGQEKILGQIRDLLQQFINDAAALKKAVATGR